MGIAMLVASVPPIALLAYIWYLDRNEREPVRLVVIIFLLSALFGTMVAAYIEDFAMGFLEFTHISDIPILGNLIFYFCVVALAEEFCKRLPVMLVAWENPAFDYRFDVIVYCVASALGFAVAENLSYVYVFGEEVALGRLIPVHAICGVFMGYYLACAKLCEVQANWVGRKRYMRLSLLIPILIHGSWDFCVTTNLVLLETAAIVGIMGLTAYAWFSLNHLAKYDAPLVLR